MSDLIDRQKVVDALIGLIPFAISDEATEAYSNGLTDAYNLICQLPSAEPEKIFLIARINLSEEQIEKAKSEIVQALPSAEPDDRLVKIADLVEGTIDHFDLDDAMDLLYQIKDVLK